MPAPILKPLRLFWHFRCSFSRIAYQQAYCRIFVETTSYVEFLVCKAVDEVDHSVVFLIVASR